MDNPPVDVPYTLAVTMMMDTVSLEFAFQNDGDAERFYDWLASQALDRGSFVVDFAGVSMRRKD